MATIDVTEKTLTQLGELALALGTRSIDRTLAGIIDRFHNGHVGTAKAPDGWALNEGITLSDLEAYYDAYDREKPVSAWHERGRVIRAAVEAGWLTMPDGATVAKLKPVQATQLKQAIDALYVKVTTDDPN